MGLFWGGYCSVATGGEMGDGGGHKNGYTERQLIQPADMTVFFFIRIIFYFIVLFYILIHIYIINKALYT